MLPIMLASPIARVEGLFRLAGSRSGPSTRWLSSAMRDVGQQQAADGLVDAAVWRSPPASAIHSAADDHAGQRHRDLHDERRRACQQRARPRPRPAAQHQRAFAADDHQAERAGSAVHSAVSISGAARCSVFCHENQVPNAPWHM